MSKLKKYISNFFSFIMKYKFTILCLLYFCTITVFATYRQLEGYISKPSIVSALFFFFLLNIIAKVRFSAFFTAIFAILVCFDAYFAFVYTTSISTGMMASIFETNKTEAGEVLIDALPIALLIIAITVTLIFLSVKELKTSRLSIKKSAICLAIYLFLIMPGIIYRKLSVNDVWAGSFSQHPLNTLQSLTAQHFPLIYSNCVTFVTYRAEMHLLNEYISSERKIPTGVAFDKTAQQAEKVFLVIGESSWREHYSLYGYPIKTTPFLDSLAQLSPSPLAYYNAIAPATFTRDATRIILSFSTPKELSPFFEYKNLIEMANSAGYETVWISGQPQMEMDGSYLGLIANFANQSFFETNASNHDIDLLPTVSKMYKADKKQFFVIHLFGSHLSYNQRYDSADEKAISGTDATAQYNRTIHHTDRVLNGIFDIMQKNNSSVMYYTPDHGEIIGVGHGFMQPGSSQFDIPLITINNSPLPIDSIVERYIDRETSLISSTSAAYILSEFMGYKVSEQNVMQSINEGRYIIHANGKIYPYSEIQSQKINTSIPK